MKRLLLLSALSFSIFAHAAVTVDPLLQKAIDFLSWLEDYKSKFVACDVQKKNDHYLLCDGTDVKRSDLAGLFKLAPAALLKEMQSRGIKVEILCDPDKKAAQTFAKQCSASSTRKTFQELTALHGMYLPEEKTILIRSSALKGSLIHEYVHYLQSQNKNPVFGKIYKRSKNEIRQELTAQMDRLIAQVQALEKVGKKTEMETPLKKFMRASALMQDMGPWQDLIDEREIFLLYIEDGQEFGASAEDVALAEKNMGFICKNIRWAPILPKQQCALAK